MITQSSWALEMLTDGRLGSIAGHCISTISPARTRVSRVYADYSYGWRNQRFYIEPSFGASYKSDDLQ